MAEIVLYVDSGFGGLHTHLYESTSDFTKLALGGVGSGVGGNWNDIVSSFVIVSGHWQAFRDINFQVPQGEVLGPGLYSFVEPFGIDNDSMSSIRLVRP
jgi:Beta/Gamma crystallin